MTATPGSAELLALADEIEESVGLLRMMPGRGGTRSLGIKKTAQVVSALRLAAKPDEEGVREATQRLHSYLAGNDPRQPRGSPTLTEDIKLVCRAALSTTGAPKPSADREVAHEDCLNCRCKPHERCKP